MKGRSEGTLFSLSVFTRRFIRPYANVFVALFWIYVRLIRQSQREGTLVEECNNDYNTAAKCFDDIIMNKGFLDASQIFLSYVASYCTRCVLEYTSTNSMSSSVLLSWFWLCVNDALGILLVFAVLGWYQKLCRWSSASEARAYIVQAIWEFVKQNVAFVQTQFQKEEMKVEQSFQKILWKDRKLPTNKILPKIGKKVSEILKDMTTTAVDEDHRWEDGLVSGAVYGGEREHMELQNKVYALYSLSNPLHPDIWPTISQCEAEVISMTANFLNGGDTNVVGSMTSGGTESILLAVRAHLKYYGTGRGIQYPEIISGTTAHAGLNKACEMFGIRLRQIECNHTTNFKLDPKLVEKKLNSNTIMVYASAPNFPQGVIDPISDLSDLVIKYGIGLHVDACLGGFLLPFARSMGIPDFDFKLPGVTSMSADTHKYGYACKGTSVVLYRNKELRSSQYFAYSRWTGGLYSTPTIAGSRNGGVIACAWASLCAIGEDGFRQRAKVILDTTREICREVDKVDGLQLLGCDQNGVPDAMIVCFGSSSSKLINVYDVAEEMSKKKWSLNSLQNPPSVHLCVTLKTVQHKDKFVKDLKQCVQDLLSKPQTEKKKEGSAAAIYGVAGSMPAGPVNELLKVYTDVTLSC